MALSSAPWKWSGGKVIGTRKTVLQMSCSPRIVQLGLDLRSRRISGLRNGMRNGPIFRNLSTEPMCVDDSNGRYVFSSRVRKS